jgi:hypothetical protein
MWNADLCASLGRDEGVATTLFDVKAPRLIACGVAGAQRPKNRQHDRRRLCRSSKAQSRRFWREGRREIF